MFHTYLMIERFKAISQAHHTVYPVIFYKAMQWIPIFVVNHIGNMSRL